MKRTMIGRFLLACFTAAMLAACSAETPGCGAEIPEIVRGLPPDYAEGEPIFDARVKSRFPVGTQEKSLLAELRRQGFAIPPKRNSKGNAYSEFTCDDSLISQTIWSVGWRAEEGRIVQIWGVYGVRAF